MELKKNVVGHPVIVSAKELGVEISKKDFDEQLLKECVEYITKKTKLNYEVICASGGCC